jgi:hypothetical protein
MKTTRLSVLSFCLSLALANATRAAGAASAAVAVGARYHVEHSAFAERPFADGDMGYGLAVEWHTQEAYWQLGATFAPDATKTETTKSVITPELNLILKDKIWRGGVGILASRIDDELSGSDWTDVYWQFLFGVQMPVRWVHLEAMAYYPFEQWNKLGDFDFGDIEFGAWLSYRF